MLKKFYSLSSGNKIAGVLLVTIPLSLLCAPWFGALVDRFVSSGDGFFIPRSITLNVTGFEWSLIFFLTLFLTLATQKGSKRFGTLAFRTVGITALVILVTNPSSIMVSPILILAGYLVGKLINIVLK